MSPEALMIFLMCVYVPIGMVMGLFAFVQILGWMNE